MITGAKIVLALILSFIIMCGLVAGCGSSKKSDTPANTGTGSLSGSGK